jgi:hypothetical protein
MIRWNFSAEKIDLIVVVQNINCEKQCHRVIILYYNNKSLETFIIYGI